MDAFEIYIMDMELQPIRGVFYLHVITHRGIMMP